MPPESGLPVRLECNDGEFRRMKILVVSSVPTHPSTAGNRARVFSICEALRKLGNEVHFAWIPQETGDVIAMESWFEGRFTRLDIGQFPPNARSLGNFCRKVLRRLGVQRAYRWGLDDWFDENIPKQLKALHGQHCFVAVLANYVFHSAVLDCFGKDVLKVLDTHDRFADRHKLLIAAGQRPEWYSTTLEAEARGLARAGYVLAIQEEEAKAFREMLKGTSSKVVTVHPFQVPITSQATTDHFRGIVVASGNPANIEGVSYLLDRVIPIVRMSIPSFQLVLAGSICNNFADAPGLVRLGRVDDLAVAYGSAGIALNPVRSGTGFCIKSLEALAYGLPLVSTRAGMRGFFEAEGHGASVVADDDPEAMALTIIEHFADLDFLRTRSLAATKFAQGWTEEQIYRLNSIFSGEESRNLGVDQ